MFDEPLAIWTFCTNPAEGQVECRGNGSRFPGERLTVNVNGMLTTVIVLELGVNGADWEWWAIDEMTYNRKYRREGDADKRRVDR